MHCHKHNNNTIMLIDGGKAKRQPVIEFDVVSAIQKIIERDESKGEIYELGGSQVYTIKELMEFLGNNLNQRPFYINFTYDDFMRMYLSPNTNWEKAAHWYFIRPDYLCRQRFDNIIKPNKGVKTFDDLDIQPLSIHHYIQDVSNWMLEKASIEQFGRQSYEEINADDEGH